MFIGSLNKNLMMIYSFLYSDINLFLIDNLHQNSYWAQFFLLDKDEVEFR